MVVQVVAVLNCDFRVFHNEEKFIYSASSATPSLYLMQKKDDRLNNQKFLLTGMCVLHGLTGARIFR